MKGILFKPESIQAIIEGRKTQTRRVIKPQPYVGAWNATAEHPSTGWFWKGLYQTWEGEIDFFKKLATCARYQVGETVYLKETWCPLIPPVYNLLDPTIPTVYKQEMDAGGAILPKEFKWRSPMMMPEWAARYFILIKDVRAERLREITVEDAIKEGVEYSNFWLPNIPDTDGKNHIRAYGYLWGSSNPKYPWESNPWVFAYTFKQERRR